MKFGNNRKLVLFILDIICFIISGIVFIGFSPSVSEKFTPLYTAFQTSVIIGFVLISRIIFKIYYNIWRYAQPIEYLKLIYADFIGGVLFVVFQRLTLITSVSFIRAVSVISVACLLNIAMRYSYQIVRNHRRNKDAADNDNYNFVNIAIVGAGSVGSALAGELKKNPGIKPDGSTAFRKLRYNPVCFIDTDKNKIDSFIQGIKVIGEDSISILEIIKNFSIEEFIIAMPDMNPEKKKLIYERYISVGKKVKVYDYPVFGEKNPDKSENRTLRDFNIEDLLFRNVQSLDKNVLKEFYSGKTVLVTGGGGSIGSELCRQIAKCAPKHVIILDIYENNAYEIQQELLNIKYKDDHTPVITVEIASVRDSEKLDELFDIYRPDIVFHAAAHKHVPLMEQSCSEAVKNNIFGTYNAIMASEKYGVSKFILISTDKAVNPTNIMGATKRMCEMIVQSMKDSRTTFSAVRFGNVLGSNGSVIPLFKKQIEAGGPVTITDKRVIRYFMTIPEASQLVMTAGAMAKSAELFVLDMGNPVKIVDLAENLIRLSGYHPYEDIDIIEIGLRPGEKLYEELLISGVGFTKTDNELIYIDKDFTVTFDEVAEKLEILKAALTKAHKTGDKSVIRRALMEVVPTFTEPDDVNMNMRAEFETA